MQFCITDCMWKNKFYLIPQELIDGIPAEGIPNSAKYWKNCNRIPVKFCSYSGGFFPRNLKFLVHGTHTDIKEFQAFPYSGGTN